MGVLRHLLHGAGAEQLTAMGAGTRAHLQKPIRRAKQARVMIDQHHGIAMIDQILDHTQEAVYVGGM